MSIYCHVSVRDDSEIADAARSAIDALLRMHPDRMQPLPRLTVERTDEGVLVRVAE